MPILDVLFSVGVLWSLNELGKQQEDDDRVYAAWPVGSPIRSAEGRKGILLQHGWFPKVGRRAVRVRWLDSGREEALLLSEVRLDR